MYHHYNIQLSTLICHNPLKAFDIQHQKGRKYLSAFATPFTSCFFTGTTPCSQSNPWKHNHIYKPLPYTWFPPQPEAVCSRLSAKTDAWKSWQFPVRKFLHTIYCLMHIQFSDTYMKEWLQHISICVRHMYVTHSVSFNLTLPLPTLLYSPLFLHYCQL